MSWPAGLAWYALPGLLGLPGALLGRGLPGLHVDYLWTASEQPDVLQVQQHCNKNGRTICEASCPPCQQHFIGDGYRREQASITNITNITRQVLI